MPSTRSCGGADGGNTDSAGIAQPADQQSAASLITNSQGSDMEVTVPTDLNSSIKGCSDQSQKRFGHTDH